MTFFCIKVIKGHGYLYRQTNHRHGDRVISTTEYMGPVEGGTPWSVRARPRQPGVSRIDLDDPIERELTKGQLQLGYPSPPNAWRGRCSGGRNRTGRRGAALCIFASVSVIKTTMVYSPQ